MNDYINFIVNLWLIMPGSRVRFPPFPLILRAGQELSWAGRQPYDLRAPLPPLVQDSQLHPAEYVHCPSHLDERDLLTSLVTCPVSARSLTPMRMPMRSAREVRSLDRG